MEAVTEPIVPTMWLPGGSILNVPESVSLGIIGETGVGKTMLARNLAMDPDYSGRVLALWSENGLGTVGEDVIRDGRLKIHQFIDGSKLDDNGRIIFPGNIAPTEVVIRLTVEMAKAKRAGAPMPKVVLLDSASGLADYESMWIEQNPEPFLTKRKKDGSGGEEDAWAKMRYFGHQFKRIQTMLRDVLNIDCIILATTSKRGELCIDGKLTPDNFARLTSFCFTMTSEATSYDPRLTAVEPAPHRSIGMDQNGNPIGIFVDRFLTTMNTGEVQAKGSSLLGLKERAIPGDILRKLHRNGGGVA